MRRIATGKPRLQATCPAQVTGSCAFLPVNFKLLLLFNISEIGLHDMMDMAKAGEWRRYKRLKT